ncbi:hypothetical protein ACKWTF_014232 [Chironomus riparius]
MIFRVLLVICLSLIKNQGVSGQTVTCEYTTSDIFVYITRFNYYLCEIELEKSKEFERILEIDGNHKDNRTNNDVKFLKITSEDSNLKEFSSIFCETFEKLEGLKIENLGISSIDDDSLQICQNLKLLSLRKNGIRNFPENFLSENSELADFEFSFNKISTIPEDAFEMLENLLKLDLENNKIDELPDKVFTALSKLEQLNLDENRLEELNPNWFKNMKNLIKLTINHNLIQHLPEDVFGNLHNITMLEMKRNQLTEIHASSFGNRARLQALFLQDNHIRSIDPKFMQESSISLLYMGGNFCYSGTMKMRDESMDTNIKRCFKNHKPITTTSSTTTLATTTTFTTSSTTPETSQKTTTTKIPLTTTKDAITTTRRTTKASPTTRSTTETSTATESTTSTKITTSQKPTTTLSTSEAATISIPAISSATESSIVFPTTRKSKPFVAFKPPCGKVQYGIPALAKGEKYVRGQFPWNVAIFRTNGKFICSGILIDSRKVVTAAQCMIKFVRDKPTEMLPRDIIVVLGSHNIYQLFEAQKTNIAVQTIHIHNDYKFESTDNNADIAVIILDSPVNSSKFIKPICLIDSEHNSLSVTSGILATYGHNNTMKLNPNFTPRKLEIQIQDFFECIINASFARISSNLTFCAKSDDGTGICVEDYGSGLYVKHEGSYYLRGILSTVISDSTSQCKTGSDSLYTDVAAYSKWIEEVPLNAYEDDIDERFG